MFPQSSDLNSIFFRAYITVFLVVFHTVFLRHILLQCQVCSFSEHTLVILVIFYFSAFWKIPFRVEASPGG